MFTSEEEEIIGRIVDLCTQDKELKKKIEDKYDHNPKNLSVYEIYVIEEVFRYGNCGYYNKLSKCGSLADVAQKYKTFMHNSEDMPELLLAKIKDYYSNSNNLSELEKICIGIILKNKDIKRKLDNKIMYTYDNYVEFKIDSDTDIKETINNALFMEVLSIVLEKMIDEHTYNDMIKRQLEPGMFANVDKDYLISVLSNMPEVGFKIIEGTNNIFADVKSDIKNGNGLEMLNKFLRGNIEDTKINISFKDAYGNLEKDKRI